ncbi:ribosomal subunit interface protein [Candidatus Parcubacteria bacterium A4]|nr:MAG: ribosomal subunit interface protein [Candidatus Parcubacteria bacterium A4]
MRIIIKATNITLSDALKVYVEKKMGSLKKFLNILSEDKKGFMAPGGKDKSTAEMWVEIEKTTDRHLQGEIFRAEAQLKLPGKGLRAEATSGDLKLAINETKNELERQLKKYKDKFMAEMKKGARKVKKEIIPILK